MTDALAMLAGDLPVDPSIGELFSKPYNSTIAKTLARRHGTDTRNRANFQMAGRLWMYDTIRSVSMDIHDYVKINKNRLHQSIRHFLVLHADQINAELKKTEVKNFIMFDLLQATTLTLSYLLRPGADEDPSETPEQMFLRIATQMYHTHGIDRMLACYRELSDRWYVPASPTIFNSGTNRPQCSSCFLLTIQDQLESILYSGVGDSGMISKLNGGLGLNLQLLRHSEIGESGMSSGVVPFLRIYDKTIECVDQGGLRKGAGTAFLRIFHIDIEDFIQSTNKFRDHTTRVSNFHTCIWTSRLFFQRAAAGQKWTLFCPARASSLNELYGYQFEKAYVEMEEEAAHREIEYQRIVIQIEGLDSFLATRDIQMTDFVRSLLDEQKILREELATSDEDRQREINSRLIGVKNLFLNDPSNNAIKEQYAHLREQKRAAKQRRITHKVINAVDLLKMIATNQISSSFPYIMHGDSINAKSNQKNLGAINSSNLCLEIVERSGWSKLYGDEEIASCNLSSLNLPRFVRGKVDWTTTSVTSEELFEAYDFGFMGEAVRSMTENLDRIIDINYYPLDKRDAHGHVIEQGKISRANFRHRPIGIGVSGLADTYYNMDLIYTSDRAFLLNRMIFACMYFNSLVESLRLAIRHGAYETFRMGTYQEYVGLVDGTPKFVERTGSPISNGKFQFDLWAEEAQYLADTNQLNVKVYDRDLDIPLSPTIWHQSSIVLKETSYDGEEVTLTIEPTWDSLRRAIMKYGVRHSLNISLMPTATSAQILGNLETTEAPQTLFYSRKLNNGNFTVTVPQLLKDLDAIELNKPEVISFILGMDATLKLFDRYVEMYHSPTPEKLARVRFLQDKYKTMFEIPQKNVIMQAAARGRYICQSQSLNVYMADPKPETMMALHVFTNQAGLKTGQYYLRQAPAVPVKGFNGDIKMARIIESLTERKGTAATLLAQASKGDPDEEVETGCTKGCAS